MTDEYDRQRDIEAEGQRAAIYHAKVREVQPMGQHEAHATGYGAGYAQALKDVEALLKSEQSDWIRAGFPQAGLALSHTAKAVAALNSTTSTS